MKAAERTEKNQHLDSQWARCSGRVHFRACMETMLDVKTMSPIDLTADQPTTRPVCGWCRRGAGVRPILCGSGWLHSCMSLALGTVYSSESSSHWRGCSSQQKRWRGSSGLISECTQCGRFGSSGLWRFFVFSRTSNGGRSTYSVRGSRTKCS